MADFLDKIKTEMETIQFNETMEYIDKHYTFTPTAFLNGTIKNEANQNNGSCKVLYFALLHQLNETQTLHLFGEYYRKDVLQHPDNTDHQNIRNFMQFGWNGIKFDQPALSV